MKSSLDLRKPPRALLCATAGIGALLLFPLLGTIPGLHGDEAWAGLRAAEILHGARPILGMNGYTGPMHQYLVAPLLHFFGYKVAVLRSLTGMTTLLTIILYYAVIERCFDRALAGLSTLLLVSLPFFTAYGRIANEVFALNPILALAAIHLLRSGGGNGFRTRVALPSLAGICLGLGTWNHVIFASVAVALFATALVRHRTSLFRSAALYAVCYGFLLALSPRILSQFDASEHSVKHLANLSSSRSAGALLERLWEWPTLLVQIAHGDILFQRFAGRVVFPSPNFIWPFLLAGCGFMLRHAWLESKGSQSVEAEVLIFACTLFLSTVFLCPANADRYFLLPLYLVPLFLAYPFRVILKPIEFSDGTCLAPAEVRGQSPTQAGHSSGSFSRGGPRQGGRLCDFFHSHFGRKCSILLLCCFVVFELSRTFLNYFVSQALSHGLGSTFLVGRQTETSNHFVRTDRLYDDLVRRHAKHIYAEFFIALPLRFYDLEPSKFPSVNIVNTARDWWAVRRAEPEFPEGTCAVVYAKELRRMGPSQYPGFAVLVRDSEFLLLAPEPAHERVQPW